jgi:hypothetical protein
MRDDDKNLNRNTTATTAANTTGTATLDHDIHDANRDPLTGEPGAHPVGTGVGAAGGGTMGAVIGGAVGGPVGAVVGAAVGGIAGALAGKGIAEGVNPTEEDTFWRNNYNQRPYAKGRTYDDLQPAYRYGWESRSRFADRTWDSAQNDLEHGWNQVKGNSKLAWNDAKYATQDAWNRVENRFGPEHDSHFRNHFSTQPYGKGRKYEDFQPAYRYGYESRHLNQGRDWDSAQNDLERGWDHAKGKTELAWDDAKHAVKDAWHKATGTPTTTSGSSLSANSTAGNFSGAGSPQNFGNSLDPLVDPVTGKKR